MSRLSLSNRRSLILYPGELDVAQDPHIFRLLRLIPSPWWVADVSCSLREYSLDRAPKYKALSYAWEDGYSRETALLQCNGIDLTISWNLHCALRRLRHTTDPVYVWVDAICINQKNDHERGYQVQLMRLIYERSEEVSIWLGARQELDLMGADALTLPDRESPPYVNWHGSNVEEDLTLWKAFVARQNAHQDTLDIRFRDVFGAFCVLWLLAAGVEAAYIIHLRHIGQSITILNGLDAIMEQSWWTRIWVIQENIVGTRAVVYYGDLSAPWAMFASAAAAYNSKKLANSIESTYPYIRSLSRFSSTVGEIEGVRSAWLDRTRLVTLLTLLRRFRTRNATDSRDKVYALLGLVQSWEGQERILPDYELDIEQVFLRTTVTAIKLRQSLEALIGTMGNPKISWVTDWSFSPGASENSRVGLAITLYNACNYMSLKPVRTHGRTVLEIHGYPLDVVSEISSNILPAQESELGDTRQWRRTVTDWERGDTGQWRKVVTEWEKLLEKLGGKDATYCGGGTVGDAFWRTLCGDSEYVWDSRRAKAGHRRAQQSLAAGYARWRSADTSLRRITSIIGGYWQETGTSWEAMIAEDPIAERKNAFHYALEYTASGRRFFITQEGFMGLGPPTIVPGDCIHVVSTSRVPFVLRASPTVVACQQAQFETLIRGKTEQTYIKAGAGAKQQTMSDQFCNQLHDDCHTLVGDVFVFGAMDGPAKLSRGAWTARPIYLV